MTDMGDEPGSDSAGGSRLTPLEELIQIGEVLIREVRRLSGPADRAPLDDAVENLQKTIWGIRQSKGKFSHAFDFAYKVFNGHEDPNDTPPAEMRAALIKRARELSDEGIKAACTCFDSTPNE